MKQNKFPEGWTEEKIKKVLASYEQQSDEAAAAEDEAGMQVSETVMQVPADLVPIVRELIAKRQG